MPGQVKSQPTFSLPYYSAVPTVVYSVYAGPFSSQGEVQGVIASSERLYLRRLHLRYHSRYGRKTVSGLHLATGN